MKEVHEMFQLESEHLGDSLEKSIDELGLNVSPNEYDEYKYFVAPALVACGYCVDVINLSIKTNPLERKRDLKLLSKPKDWELLGKANYWHGVVMGRLDGLVWANYAKKAFSKKGAIARNKENHDIKQQLLDWYKQEGHKYKSVAKAANAAKDANLANIEHRTIYDWFRAYKKSVQSAS